MPINQSGHTRAMALIGLSTRRAPRGPTTVAVITILALPTLGPFNLPRPPITALTTSSSGIRALDPSLTSTNILHPQSSTRETRTLLRGRSIMTIPKTSTVRDRTMEESGHEVPLPRCQHTNRILVALPSRKTVGVTVRGHGPGAHQVNYRSPEPMRTAKTAWITTTHWDPSMSLSYRTLL
jgi:hypothetical protein